ncbi:Hypothetical protein AJAP_27205 [Amycolatopsis japonica]|uniref:DUF3046 domain-containing protein n=2 Tax=Pseudonocardiaceae TaxID=2070 RepID=A0A075UVV2_9PSEU|nr:Hypothetical protein AJAP_27205 [Amycolatopsis japonica]
MKASLRDPESLKEAFTDRARLRPMRITVFRRLMADEFGPGRAETLSRDHVFGELGGRTVEQALDAGTSAKDVWRAVCDAFEVPPERR